MFPELLPHSQISNELWFKELNIQEQGCIFDPLFSLAACLRLLPLIGPHPYLITSKCLLPPGHFLSGIFSRTPGEADGSWLRCPGVASDEVTGPGPGKGGARGGHCSHRTMGLETRVTVGGRCYPEQGYHALNVRVIIQQFNIHREKFH